MWKILVAFMVFLLACTSALALEPTYNIVVKDNGQSVVLVELEKGGTYTIKVPPDAQIEAKGALFVRNESTITAYTGSVKKGLIAYTTELYTAKIKDVWQFSADFGKDIPKITVVVPEQVYLKSFEPQPVIHNNKLIFNNTKSVSVSYSFVANGPEEDVKTVYIYLGLTGLALAGICFMVWYIKKPKELSAQQNIVKTLPHNERRIINILLEHGGEIKRNLLERTSKISKSSLANSLNNLEKKNIIEIDKTFVVHTVRLSEWFKGI